MKNLAPTTIAHIKHSPTLSQINIMLNGKSLVISVFIIYKLGTDFNKKITKHVKKKEKMHSEENKQATTGRLTYDTDIRIIRDGIGVTMIDYVKD